VRPAAVQGVKVIASRSLFKAKLEIAHGTQEYRFGYKAFGSSSVPDSVPFIQHSERLAFSPENWRKTLRPPARTPRYRQ
jgi:hypothetical protein